MEGACHNLISADVVRVCHGPEAGVIRSVSGVPDIGEINSEVCVCARTERREAHAEHHQRMGLLRVVSGEVLHAYSCGGPNAAAWRQATLPMRTYVFVVQLF